MKLWPKVWCLVFLTHGVVAPPRRAFAERTYENSMITVAGDRRIWYTIFYGMVIMVWRLLRLVHSVRTETRELQFVPEMDMVHFSSPNPTQPTMLTQGPNPTHLRRAYSSKPAAAGLDTDTDGYRTVS